MSMMSPFVNISCDYTPCFGQPDFRSQSLCGTSQYSTTAFPCSSTPCRKNGYNIKNGNLTCVFSRDTLICNANSGGHKRNPYFSKLNKHGSHGLNGQNEDGVSFDSLDESQILSSNKGPFLSLSNSTRSRATASTGSKEREIVELFRKVQAQLRERAAAKKEDKRVEDASRATGNKSGTVDSLLKLLRKHSGDQVNRKVSSFRNQEFSSDQSERTDKNSEDLTRPPSSFRHKSPVQRFKSQPTYYSGEETFDSLSSYNSVWTRKKDSAELNRGLEVKSIPSPVSQTELTPDSSLYETEDEEGDAAPEYETPESDDDDDDDMKYEDLNALKLTELRATAKSRGAKGFSKMKKAEIVELLSGYSE